MGAFLPPEHVFQESDSYTCGPCCLAMGYHLKNKKITLKDILRDFHHPEKGKPTSISQLGEHLEKEGIKTRIVVSSSKYLSPAWKNLPKDELFATLKKWLSYHKDYPYMTDVEYLPLYLEKGGEVVQESYAVQTIKTMLNNGSYVILGVDGDWIWGHRLQLVGDKRVVNDFEGIIEGHFILVTSYKENMFHILDPFPTNLEDRHGEYDVDENQLVNASLTWDLQILEILG